MACMRTWWIAGAAALAACGTPTPSDGIVSGSRLKARFMTAEGGARQFQGWHDSELDVDCSVFGDEMRCYPDASSTGLFADATCDTPLVNVFRDATCSPVPAFVATYTNAPCSYGYERLWHTGAKVSPSMVYSKDLTGACVGSAPDPQFDYYTAGAEVALDSLVGAHYEREGDGAIQDNVLVADDGARRPSGPWLADADTYCYDDGGHCIPEYRYAYQSADDTCSHPVAADYACDPPPARIGAYVHDDMCTGHLELYEAGPKITPTTIYDLNEADCSPQTADGDYWSAGAPISNDSFPAIARAPAHGSARIQPYTISGDGFVQVVGDFRDTELDEDCYAVQVAADEWRCNPGNVAYVDRSFYGDASCQSPVQVVGGYADACAGIAPAPPAAVIDTVPADDGCTSYAVLHAVGAEVTNLYYLNGGTCTPATADDSVKWYAVGDVISWDRYARLRPTID